MKVFASDLSQEENRDDDDWQREFLEGNQERQNQRKERRPESKRNEEREERIGRKESLKTKEVCDSSSSRRKPRVRVRSAPQSRKFAPTVPEPFGMTVREEERRKTQELALASASVKPSEEELKVKVAGEEGQFKAIPMPDHIKDETRCREEKSTGAGSCCLSQTK